MSFVLISYFCSQTLFAWLLCISHYARYGKCNGKHYYMFPAYSKCNWRRKWYSCWEYSSIPVFLLRKSREQRSLLGYCPWGCEELDTTAWQSTNCSSTVKGKKKNKGLLSSETKTTQNNIFLKIYICNVQLALQFCVYSIHRVIQSPIKNTPPSKFQKIPKSKIWIFCDHNYLHNIWILFTLYCCYC